MLAPLFLRICAKYVKFYVMIGQYKWTKVVILHILQKLLLAPEWVILPQIGPNILNVFETLNVDRL